MGITFSRVEAAELLETTQAGPLPYNEVWGILMPLKGIAQWRTKLVTLGARKEDVVSLANHDVGKFLYRRLSRAMSIPLQDLQPNV